MRDTLSRSLVSVLLISVVTCTSDESVIAWTFRTDGRIVSHPSTDGNAVYFGNSSGTFYAVEVRNGREIWSRRTPHAVRGTALIGSGAVYFVSGNDVYALEKTTGAEVWSFSPDDQAGANQIDPWDYHTGRLALYGSTIYAGLGNGYVVGVDTASGYVTTRIATTDTSPVRSGMLAEDGVLYFGDWNGRVYAYDLQSDAMIWSVRTFDERPYKTFGALTSNLVVDGDLLFFGARNTKLQVLNRRTGSVAWSYFEESGGWISGDPVVEGGILYIGGSDNHELFAFESGTGKKLWDFEFVFNNFSRALIHDDVIYLTTGDAYSVYGEGVGRGFLYVVNTDDGSLRNVRMIGGNSYSSPILAGGRLVFGSEDSCLYAFDTAALLSEDFDAAPIGYDAVRIHTVHGDSVITYAVNYPALITVEITTLSDSTLRRLTSAHMSAGEYSLEWDGKDDGGVPIDGGYYFVKAGSGDFYRTAFIQKSTSR